MVVSVKGLLFCVALVAVSPAAFAQSNDARSQLAAQAETARAEVATGQDLVAWQTLEQRRLTGSSAVEAYKGFLTRYVGSPLAVMAWERLVELGAPLEAWMEDPQVKLVIAPVRRAWEQAQRALTAAATRRPVQMMDLGDAVVEEDEARDTGR
jgi:hypothetical protein